MDPSNQAPQQFQPQQPQQPPQPPAQPGQQPQVVQPQAVPQQDMTQQAAAPTNLQQQPQAQQPSQQQYAAASAMEYSSNPFRAASKGLAKILTVNPISTLTTGLIAIVVLLGGYIATILLTALVPAGIGRVLVLLIGFVALIILAVRAAAAVVQVFEQSEAGQTVTGRQAYGSLSSPGFGGFFFTMFLLALFTLLGLIVLIIPGIIIGSRLSLAPFVVYREKLKGMAAIKRSWQLTKGHTWEMIAANLAGSFMTGGSAGLLGFGGGYSAVANRYNELSAAEAAGTSTGKVHWMNYFLPGVLLVAVIFYIVAFSLISKAALQSNARKVEQQNELNNYTTQYQTTTPGSSFDSSDSLYQ